MIKIFLDSHPHKVLQIQITLRMFYPCRTWIPCRRRSIEIWDIVMIVFISLCTKTKGRSNG